MHPTIEAGLYPERLHYPSFHETWPRLGCLHRQVHYMRCPGGQYAILLMTGRTCNALHCTEYGQLARSAASRYRSNHVNASVQVEEGLAFSGSLLF